MKANHAGYESLIDKIINENKHLNLIYKHPGCLVHRYCDKSKKDYFQIAIAENNKISFRQLQGALAYNISDGKTTHIEDIIDVTKSYKIVKNKKTLYKFKFKNKNKSIWTKELHSYIPIKGLYIEGYEACVAVHKPAVSITKFDGSDSFLYEEDINELKICQL